MLLKKRFLFKKLYLFENKIPAFINKRNIVEYQNNCYNNICNYVDNPKKRLPLIVNEKCIKKLLRGYPWIFSNEIKNADELILYSPCLVNIKNEFNESVAIGIYNKNSTICSRVLTKDVKETINEYFFEEKIKKAYEKRINIFTNDDFYRVVNAESDFLPGVIIDKYGKTICVQVNASGLDILLPMLLKSIERVFNPETIILKHDSSIKKLEKLNSKKEVYKGVYNGPTKLQENGLTFFVDILNGQKTGWYFDQRENRSMLISFSKNKKVLDLFSYIGSFGITLAYYGAKQVTCVDSSYSAICNGIMSASYNNVFDKITFVHSCVKLFLNATMNAHLSESNSLHLNHFLVKTKQSEKLAEEVMHVEDAKKSDKTYTVNCTDENDNLPAETKIIMKRYKQPFLSEMNIHVYESKQMRFVKEWNIEEDGIEQLLVKNKTTDFLKTKYDVILIDPPPLAKTHCLVASALKIYEKLLFVSFKILQKPGYVFVSSCNRLIGYTELNACIKKSLHWAKCEGVIISEGKIGADHPIHVALPETRYLTSLLLFIS